MSRSTLRKISGFTIVELLVVIVVIGILATITIVAYRGVSQKATETAIVADLVNLSKKLKLNQIESSNFPDSISKITDCPIPAAGNLCLKPSKNNSFGVYYVNNTASPQTFCLTIINNNIKKNINQDGIINDGACTYPFAGSLIAATISRSRIDLSWDSIPSASNYIVQKANNPSFTDATEVYSGTNISAQSTGLSPSTQYYFRVKVTIAGDDSNWSGTTIATTLDFPAPTGLAATATSSSAVSLSWGAVTGATGYLLQRDTNSSFTAPTTVSSALVTTASSSGLSLNTPYYYRVNVTDAEGTSIWSPTLTVTFVNRTQTYTSPGNIAFTVPAAVTSIQIETWGAQGGNGNGGYGGYAKGNLSVTPGKTLGIYVGGQGSCTAGGYNGGANGGPNDSEYFGESCGGGGASDVRYDGTLANGVAATTLASRKIVAGGGGGGYNAAGSGGTSDSSGGYGGGASGGSSGGSGGTQSAGCALGQGCSNATGSFQEGYSSGAGGGGGYWGGNAGSTLTGGGGGSGYVGGVTSGTMSNGVQAGNGKVVLTYISL